MSKSVTGPVAGASALLMLLLFPVALIMLFVLGSARGQCGGQTSAAVTSAVTSANVGVSNVGPSKPGDHRWTQSQLTAAVAKVDPQQAVALGAIAMAETSGWDFPTTNPTGEYHSPWAIQAAWAGKLYDLNRLDSDLNYAAAAAAKLADSGITTAKWATWPGAAARYMPGGSLAGQAAPVAGGQMPAQQVACLTAFESGPGGVASADGVTFPLKTSKTAILAGSVAVGGGVERWCYTSQANCHHDYNAADIMVATGTTVLAPVSGTIVNTHAGLGASCVYDNRGDNFSMRQDGNNMAWFMGHMLTGTLSVHVGDHVMAGQPIGEVGRASEAQCTVPHLHVQENPPGDYGGQQNSLNIQPVLVSLFAKLP